MSIKGACECGEITLEVPKQEQTTLCHCKPCRKTSGSMAGLYFAVPPSDIKVTGTPSTYVRKGESGQDVETFFCGTCASPLYSYAHLVQPVRFVRCGLFENDEVPEPSLHIFGRNMAPWEQRKGEVMQGARQA